MASEYETGTYARQPRSQRFGPIRGAYQPVALKLACGCMNVGGKQIDCVQHKTYVIQEEP